MSKYYFCIDCEYIKTKMVPGFGVPMVKEMSCPLDSTRWKGSGFQ